MLRGLYDYQFLGFEVNAVTFEDVAAEHLVAKGTDHKIHAANSDSRRLAKREVWLAATKPGLTYVVSDGQHLSFDVKGIARERANLATQAQFDAATDTGEMT